MPHLHERKAEPIQLREQQLILNGSDLMTGTNLMNGIVHRLQVVILMAMIYWIMIEVMNLSLQMIKNMMVKEGVSLNLVVSQMIHARKEKKYMYILPVYLEAVKVASFIDLLPQKVPRMLLSNTHSKNIIADWIWINGTEAKTENKTVTGRGIQNRVQKQVGTKNLMNYYKLFQQSPYGSSIVWIDRSLFWKDVVLDTNNLRWLGLKKDYLKFDGILLNKDEKTLSQVRSANHTYL